MQFVRSDLPERWPVGDDWGERVTFATGIWSAGNFGCLTLGLVWASDESSVILSVFRFFFAFCFSISF